MGNKLKDISLNDKVTEMIKRPSKLLAIHLAELREIRSKSRTRVHYYKDYINQLYNHYVIEKLTKEQFKE